MTTENTTKARKSNKSEQSAASVPQDPNVAPVNEQSVSASGEHNPPTDSAPEVTTDALKSEWGDLHRADVARENRKSEIEGMIAKRLVATGKKGACVTMPDGKKYTARVYGDDIKGPMKGKTILVERKESEEAAI